MPQHAPHHHHHSHAHHHAHDVTEAAPRIVAHRWSLLLSGAGERLAVVAGLVAMLWLVTFWALQ